MLESATLEKENAHKQLKPGSFLSQRQNDENVPPAYLPQSAKVGGKLASMKPPSAAQTGKHPLAGVRSDSQPHGEALREKTGMFINRTTPQAPDARPLGSRKPSGQQDPVSFLGAQTPKGTQKLVANPVYRSLNGSLRNASANRTPASVL